MKHWKERLLSGISVRDPQECWNWQRSRDKDGYGWFKIDGRTTLAHRASFLAAHGRWPQPCCLHRCDNPACCNPAHLFEGTNLDNVSDMVSKGRQTRVTGDHNGARTKPERLVRGERVTGAKLTADQVREMRALYSGGGILQRELGVRYGVNQSTVSEALRGVAWQHVESHE